MDKLYKTNDGKKVCGVCAGLAEYLKLDVSLVRILWVVVTLFCGVGLLIYIACALILPEKAEVKKKDEPTTVVDADEEKNEEN